MVLYLIIIRLKLKLKLLQRKVAIGTLLNVSKVSPHRKRDNAGSDNLAVRTIEVEANCCLLYLYIMHIP